MHVPGSKSITNRALICAALAQGTSELLNASESDDTALMINALNLLGVFAKQGEDRLIVEGQGGRLSAPKFPIPVGNAGTTFRFLVSIAALADGTTRFELSPRMAERPIDDLTQALGQLGVLIERDPSGLFVTVTGGGLRGGNATVRGARSSQFVSSLLLATPRAVSPVSISIEGRLASTPYVRMTIEVMRAFGISLGTIPEDLHRFDVPSGQRFKATRYAVEPDASGASYPFGAAAIAGGSVAVEGFRRRSLQGDAAFVEVLARMGCSVGEDTTSLTISRMRSLTGIDVDMNAMPDCVPTLAAIALFADGPTRIRNVGHLRYKESNRLETLAEELRKLGARIEVSEDGMQIIPVPLHGAVMQTHDDHRLAMIFALIGLRIPDILIEGAECVSKSFPAFWEEMRSLTTVEVSR